MNHCPERLFEVHVKVLRLKQLQNKQMRVILRRDTYTHIV